MTGSLSAYWAILHPLRKLLEGAGNLTSETGDEATAAIAAPSIMEKSED
jgi:hypothetical protein